MAKPALDDEAEKPLDPAVENVRRKLVRFALVNLGLLFLALMAVVAAIVYKSRVPAAVATAPGAELPAPAAGAMIEGDILLPLGARIVSQSLAGSRVALDVELAEGGRILYLYDLAERRLIGRFKVVAQ